MTVFESFDYDRKAKKAGDDALQAMTAIPSEDGMGDSAPSVTPTTLSNHVATFCPWCGADTSELSSKYCSQSHRQQFSNNKRPKLWWHRKVQDE